MRARQWHRRTAAELKMKVLALCTYPVEAAATRYRVAQFIEPLTQRGIELTLRPLLNAQEFSRLYRREYWPRTALALVRGALSRVADVWRAGRFDALFIQREAMLFGPPLVEWLAMQQIRGPLVLDLDDATYLSYVSPTYGRLVNLLKWFGKTDDLIRWATVVTCGNPAIAQYVTDKGKRAIIIPTVCDTTQFRPREDGAERAVPVVGWIGTHSTYPYLETLFPVLADLARNYRFRLKVVGAGRAQISVPGVEVETDAWSLPREAADFQSLDIGLYPLRMDEWAAGKSGFKAVQYMSVGVPFVVTPVGICAEMGEPNVTHFMAATPVEWYDALARLLSSASLRRQMGTAGRRHALAHYALLPQVEKLADALHDAVSAYSAEGGRSEAGTPDATRRV